MSEKVKSAAVFIVAIVILLVFELIMQAILRAKKDFWPMLEK